MRNLEFKAPLADGRAALSRARRLGAELWGDLHQTDTYFNVSRGRLKLRETATYGAELIFYERAEESAGRPSDYFVTAVTDAASARDVLGRALGIQRVLRKRRTLVMLDSVRIHFDNVDGLGQFLEIEVPVRDDEDAAARRLTRLIESLGYSWADCIRRSYLDLVTELAT
jgi:predicted adenylyl cyclase CyaB